MCERTLVELLRKMEAITNHLLEENHGEEYVAHVVELRELIKNAKKHIIENELLEQLRVKK